MKKIILYLLIVIPSFAFAQNDKATWDYPVKPGSEEWRYPPYVEKLQKNQPPASVINQLTTNDLLDLCLQYPFNKDILLFNNPNIAMRKVLKESFGWQEFIKRKDAVEIFIGYYNKLPTDKIEAIPDEKERNNERFNFYFFEKLIAESDFAINANLNLKKLLLQTLLKKHNEKKIYPDQYHGYVYYSTISAMLRIMEEQGLINDKIYNNTDFQLLIEKGICKDQKLEIEIINKAKDFLAK